MDSQHQKITTDHPLRVFLRYTIPGVLGLLAISSAQTVDAIFIGNYVGSEALAAVNIVIPFFYFIFGLAVMMIVGSSVRCGKYIGEKNLEAASSIFSKTVILLVVVSALIMVSGILFPGPIVELLGANDEIAPISALYLRIILYFTIPFLGTYALAIFVKVDERPVLSSVGLISCAVVNLFLDWLLVAILDMGIVGAAVATGSAQIISFLVLMSYFFSSRRNLQFSLKNQNWKEIPQAAFNGLSEFVNEISAGLMILIFNWIMISSMGVPGVAAFTVINFIMAFGIMIAYGVSDSIMPLISTNFGALQFKRINRFLSIASFSILGVGIILFTLLTIAPKQMVDIFLESEAQSSAAIALEFAQLVKWAFLFNGINMILSAYFTAMHRPMESVVVAFSRSLVFPVIAVILLPKLVGTTGIYFAIPLAEIITFGIAVVLLVKNRPSKLVQSSQEFQLTLNEGLKN